MPKYHYMSKRYQKPWADNNERVCVLPQKFIIPFKRPIYWNNDSKKTPTKNIAAINNYSFTPGNEDKITTIEKEACSIIESFLKNKVLPNEVDLDPLYHLITLFWCNNPTFREGMKNVLNRNLEQIIAALKEGIGYQGDREFFMRPLNNVNSLASASLQIADMIVPYIKENFRFQLLRSHPKKSFITSDVPIILIPPSNQHSIFSCLWRITKFTWYYENGAVGELQINLNNQGQIKGCTLYCPESFNEYTLSPDGHCSYQYHISGLNIHKIYFPISPQLALYGVNSEYSCNEYEFLPHSIFLMLSKNETLELNSWVLNYISDHSKTKAIGSNYGILEESAIYYNSQNITGSHVI